MHIQGYQHLVINTTTHSQQSAKTKSDNNKLKAPSSRALNSSSEALKNQNRTSLTNKISSFIKGTTTAASAIFTRLFGKNTSPQEELKDLSTIAEKKDPPLLSKEELKKKLENFSIAGKNIDKFTGLMLNKGQSKPALQTLNDIHNHISKNQIGEKFTPHSENLHREGRNVKSFGWSIHEDGKIFIRIPGNTAGKDEAYCLNDGQTYDHITIPKPKKAGEVSSKIEKNAINLGKLNNLKIPNVPATPKTIKSTTKSGSEETSFIQEKFQIPAERYCMKYQQDQSETNLAEFKTYKFRIYDIFKKSSETLAALESKGLCHTNFNPKSILIDEEANKIVVSNWNDLREVNKPVNSQSSVYSAPELKEKKEATSKADAYALGATMFEMLFSLEVLNAIQKMDYGERFLDMSINNQLTKLGLTEKSEDHKILKEVMLGLLNPDPAGRMSCKDARNKLQNLGTTS